MSIFFIRADGNSHIGMGHLMRTMSIAAKLSNRTKVVYLTTMEEAALEIHRHGYEAVLLKCEPFSEEEALDICRLADQLKEDNPLILIDSYSINDKYLNVFSGKIKRVIMDDLAEYPYVTDALINYNTYADESKYEKLYLGKRFKPLFLLGGKYIPLRDEFSVNCDRDFEKIENILITTGGSDEYNLATKIVVKILEKNDALSKAKIHVVSGAFNNNSVALAKLSNQYTNIIVHNRVYKMSELMAECDLAVSAGGSTCYELCAMGLPFVVFAYAKNQTQIIEDMSVKNIALNAGYIDFEHNDNIDTELVIGQIVDNLEILAGSKEERKLRSIRGRDLIDGQGALQLANRLIGIKEGIRI